MNFASVPVACAWRYLNSATSFSVVLLASADVDGLGGRAARKSPYAGDSWSLTSARYLVCARGKASISLVAYRR